MKLRHITLPCLLALFACQPSDPIADGEMHWAVPKALTQCTADTDCGHPELACLCGVCSTTCEAASACDAAPGEVACVQGTGLPGSCGDVAASGGVCLEACAGDDACDAGLMCDQGRCVDPGFVPECAVDTDADSLRDCDERYYELDPTRPVTRDDGVADAERWFVDACPPPSVAGCTQCDVWRADAEQGRVELLFVLDLSGSMTDNLMPMPGMMRRHLEGLQARGVSARVAMTTLDEASDGRPVGGWYDDGAMLESAAEALIAGAPPFGEEFGLSRAKQGIEYLRSPGVSAADALREGTELITIFVTDEDSGEVTTPCTEQMCPESIERDFVDFFRDQTRVLAIVSFDLACGATEGPTSYQRLASVTQGQSLSLCDTTELPTALIAGWASRFQPTRPLDDGTYEVLVGDMSVTQGWSVEGGGLTFESAPQEEVVVRWSTCE